MPHTTHARPVYSKKQRREKPGNRYRPGVLLVLLLLVGTSGGLRAGELEEPFESFPAALSQSGVDLEDRLRSRLGSEDEVVAVRVGRAQLARPADVAAFVPLLEDTNRVHAGHSRTEEGFADRGRIERSIDRSRGHHSTGEPKTFSQTSMPVPFIQAVCNSPVWSRSHRLIWCIM